MLRTSRSQTSAVPCPKISGITESSFLSPSKTLSRDIYIFIVLFEMLSIDLFRLSNKEFILDIAFKLEFKLSPKQPLR